LREVVVVVCYQDHDLYRDLERIDQIGSSILELGAERCNDMVVVVVGV
jgi:hypothetical protein